MSEIAQRQLAALIEELRDVLEDERRALLSGTAEMINTVTFRKMQIADQIEAATHAFRGAPRPSLEELQPLVRYNQENAIICATMVRHLTAAIDRLRRRDPHRSYRADGSEQNSSAHHALGAA